MPKPPLQYDLPNLEPAQQGKSDYKAFTQGPNPDLPDFIRRHTRSMASAKSDKRPPAFDKDLIVYKHNKLYTMHVYWSKKDPLTIAEYIRHYTEEGDLVLDPFCGSGTTGCASRLTNRHVILSDPSPAAAFIASHYCTFSSSEDASDAYNRLLADGRLEKVDELFKTTCHKCGGPGLIEYMIWSDTYQCPSCALILPLFSCPEVYVDMNNSEKKKRRVCPKCLAKNSGVPKKAFAISTRSLRFEPVPVASKYICLRKCTKRSIYRSLTEATDKALRQLNTDIRHALARDLDAKVSTGFKSPFPKGYRYKRDALFKFNIEVLGDLFTPRNRGALSALLSVPHGSSRQIDARIFITWILHKTSLLMGCGADGVGRINMGTYYVPPIRMEARPTKYLKQAKSQIVAHFKEKSRHHSTSEHLITNEPALKCLSRIPPSTVDYIFTDPAYNYKVQYGELNYPWEALLRFKTDWVSEEIVENPYQGKSFDDWSLALRKCISGMFRVLKPDKCLSLCYHDTDPGTWTVVQNMLLDCGFVIESVTALQPLSQSRNAITAEIVVKSDLVINCRKPLTGKQRESSDSDDLDSVSERVKVILVDMLSISGGQARDRLWDAILKRLLTRGQMAEHRFDDILGQVAFRSESGRWFLKEEFEQLSQSDIRNEEEAGAAIERFARLRSMGVPAEFAAQISIHSPNLAGRDIEEEEVEAFITANLIEDPALKRKFKLKGRLKGVEFYDCLFFYLTRFLKVRSGGKTPRRNLADFLEEYLVRFKEGDKWLYRPSDKVESETLRRSRQTGVGRRIRQYVAFLRGEGDFPKAKMPDAKTLLAWLKYCSTFGLVDEGVMLYEKGGLQLQPGTDDYYDADEYYRNCRRKASKPQAEDDEAEEAEEAEDAEETEE